MRLWRYDESIPGDKFLVLRRDGTVVEWAHFTLGARDPAAPAALRAYAETAERLEWDPLFVADVRRLADEFEAYRETHGEGDPDAPPHRKDDPEIVARMPIP